MLHLYGGLVLGSVLTYTKLVAVFIVEFKSCAMGWCLFLLLEKLHFLPMC